jgi:arylsulfatase
MTEPHPNILLICTDQQRYDTINALGNPLVRSPHIDMLIESGVACTNVFAQSPVCTASRASFLTGRYPRTTRCRQNGQRIPEDERLFSRLLADEGYYCGLAGKLHLSSCANGQVEDRIDDGFQLFHWSHHPQPDWQENAYTQWLTAQGKTWDELYNSQANQGTPYVKPGVPAKYHQTTWCADMTIDFIRDRKTTAPDQPWLFVFNCFDPHHPFDPPADYLDKYFADDIPLPKYKPGELNTKPQYQQLDHQWAHNNKNEYDIAAMTDQDKREVTAAYYAMCELIDDNVGRMIAALDETDQRKDTLVIFMSDHGELLGDHGIYLKGPHFYDEAIHVPLVFNWPGQLKAGSKVTGLVELTDLAPTIMQAAGYAAPNRMQGQGLLPQLQGRVEGSHVRDHVFSEYYNAWTHDHAYGSMLRTTNTKIIVYHGEVEGVSGELYDLTKDPDEFENLWDKPKHKALQKEMTKRCFDASVFTMDPLPERKGQF